jgi:hypothetical protein
VAGTPLLDGGSFAPLGARTEVVTVRFQARKLSPVDDLIVDGVVLGPHPVERRILIAATLSERASRHAVNQSVESSSSSPVRPSTALGAAEGPAVGLDAMTDGLQPLCSPTGASMWTALSKLSRTWLSPGRVRGAGPG